MFRRLIGTRAFYRSVLSLTGAEGAALSLKGMHNGGITFYQRPVHQLSREEQIKHWLDYFSGSVD